MAPFIPPGSVPSRLIAFEDLRPSFPEICFVATTGGGRCAVIFEYVGENLTMQDTYISEFPSIGRMQQWYMNSSQRGPHTKDLPPDVLTYVVPGVAKQLVANAATFTLLLTRHNRNCVYTWGTPSATAEMLGRALSPLNPPDRPRMVKYLDNPELDITQIRGGGGYAGALNEAEGMVYLWGVPGSAADELTDFAFAGDDFVAVACPGERHEPLPRIRDFDIGEDHVALLDRTGRVFIAGSNRFGQLGLGAQVPFSPAWRRAAPALEPYVVAVSCAAYCTYLLVDESRALRDEVCKGAKRNRFGRGQRWWQRQQYDSIF
ncbi:uncharacterized protein K452DRAFT_287895 [Aplosporella prunicola CBS 121167]|uniref:RCC1/BLIP-II protein n=1 Tax=Aplosporella prunicola CBS 121167 TaxID=1176127 RepID=A0A6A6BAY2_9PEZI|nr:uncharacterized protein K452DRAFT_287895 [Aplosporella prunicola CBS 121167]KAF2141186.1 hypothetical protein K452DRAFT_287895 [Aplosporella prunicola CBS 121167]